MISRLPLLACNSENTVALSIHITLPLILLIEGYYLQLFINIASLKLPDTSFVIVYVSLRTDRKIIKMHVTTFHVLRPFKSNTKTQRINNQLFYLILLKGSKILAVNSLEVKDTL